STTNIRPPVARKDPQHTQLHGHTLTDDYAWLRNKESPEVTAHLEAENAYTAAIMEPAASLIDTLYAEMLSHIQQTDVSAPYLKNSYYYYSRIVEGQQYPLYCRIPAPPDQTALPPLPPKAGFSNEEILLDVNVLAEGQAFMAIGISTISDDGNLLAYTTDNTGFRQYTLYIKDLRTGKTTEAVADRVGSVAWAADNRTIFYTVEDEETKRQHQLYRHAVDTPDARDALIYEDPDERFNVGIGRTRDGAYLLLETASHTTSEQSFLSASAPAESFRCMEPRRDNIEYYADHREGQFYIRVNDTGRNFRLVTAPVETCGKENWTEILPHRADIMLEDFDLFRDFNVVCERVEGLPHLRVFDLTGNRLPQEITFPEPAYRAAPDINLEFDTKTYRYNYQSLITPPSVYQYDVATAESALLKQVEVPGGFDRALYASERIFATASDGTRVPISLVYRKNRFQRGTNPLYVYGYGSYGYSLPIGFSSNRLSLLDRGLVLAYAHIRGGGEMGKPWHDAGRMMQKRNTFTDFIACVDHLLATGYGAAGRVAIEGGSAGGLLMGAVTNRQPDLFRVVLSHVPFVDVMNTMLDATLPLTVPEYEEWGNPNEKAAFEYMLSYSPYDNLQATKYPAMLVKTSLNDSQVMYWEPAKYVAKLRTQKEDDNLLLLHTNMAAGHGGASGRYDYLKEIAFDYAFLLWQLESEKLP
ncbi:MAG TPA: S9 family peptidase, partial [Acidobacteriaceae bacterium]|nr:S9 family peptidase [Acidobacteriaceae bacterium]